MLVGEIGISRHEFYYELKWWEVRSIIRGYNARHHAGWEQARLVAYNAHYCMGAKNTPPVVSEWIKFPWEKDIETSDGGNMPSASDIEEMRRMMREENARLEAKKD